jgi:hypothetical protein
VRKSVSFRVKFDRNDIRVNDHIGSTGRPEMVCATDEIEELRSVECELIEEAHIEIFE